MCNRKWYLQIIKHIDGEDDISIDIRAKDFGILREIILHQNGVEYDDFSGAYIKGLLLHFEYNSTKVTKLPSVVYPHRG